MFRRGKLTFLTTKDDRIKIINERINITEKNLLIMCSTFSECARKMAKYRDSYDELAKGFKNYADEEEINESLCEGMKSFTNAVTILGDYMDLQVHRLEAKIINELIQFENVCKNTRDSLRTAVIARDKEVLKQRQMLEIKSKFAANNSAADSELLKAKMEVNRTNKEIDEVISNFEKRKLHDIKVLLNDFILISLKYHTKALEALSASYYDVSNIDERDDFLAFQKLMKTKEDAQSRKQALKKGLRSQSMESLDRDQLLSPLKRRSGKTTRSNKNLANKEQDDDEEEEEDEDEEAEEEEENSDEQSDEADDTDTEEEENDKDDNAAGTKSGDSGNELKANTDNKKFKTKLQAAKRQPFKTLAASTTHVRLARQ